MYSRIHGTSFAVACIPLCALRREGRAHLACEMTMALIIKTRRQRVLRVVCGLVVRRKGLKRRGSNAGRHSQLCSIFLLTNPKLVY